MASGSTEPGWVPTPASRASPLLAAHSSSANLPQRPFCTLSDFSSRLLVHALAENESANVCLSPFGVTVALCMAMAGAGEATTTQMVDVMGAIDPNALYRTCEKISAMLNSAEAHTKVFLGSKMFVSKSVPLNPEFMETVAETFSDEVGLLDFSAGPADAIRVINSWAAKVTEGQLAEVVKLSDVNTNTRLLLVSAIYFRGLWGESFAKSVKAAFHVSATETVDVDMMESLRTAHHCRSQVLPCEALELSYVCRALSMIVLLPEGNTTLGSLATMLNYAHLKKLMKELRSVEKIAVWLPRLRLNRTYRLDSCLNAMGIKNLFDDRRADLSKMTAGTTSSLSVDSVVHEALFEINEDGMGEASRPPAELPPGIPAFRANRPFLFVLLHHFNHAVVYIGAVRRP